MSNSTSKAFQEHPASDGDGDDSPEHTTLIFRNGSSYTASAHVATTQPFPGDANGDDCDTDTNLRTIKDDDKPLPMLQIFVLSYARLVEPLIFFSIFPFVNQLIVDVGSVAEEDVGLYSGLIESIFSFTQIFSMLFWGRIADKFGYKKVLLISLLGQAITAAMFGLATSVAEMIFYRCLAGIFGGTVVTVRVLFTLHSTPKTEARAFSFFALSANIAIFLGPFIGGLLAQPATQFPRIPRLFHVHPYFLPTLVTGLYALSAAIVAALWLEEPKVIEKKMALDSTTSADGVEQDSNSNSPPSYKQILKSEGVLLALTVYGLVSMLAIGFTAIAPLWWFTPIPLGGLGLKPRQISVMLGTIGFSQAFWMIVVFPPLHRKLGTVRLVRLCAVALPTRFVIMPVTLLFMRRHADEAAFWTCALCILVFSSGISTISSTVAQLLLNAVSPSHHALGTLNGIALSLMSAIRAASPVIFSTIFAIGVRERILSGNLIWIPLISLGVILRFTLLERWIPENVRERDELVMKGGGVGGADSVGAQGRAGKRRSLITSGSERSYGATGTSER